MIKGQEQLTAAPAVPSALPMDPCLRKDLDLNRELRYHRLDTDNVAVLAGTFSCVRALVLLMMVLGVF